MCRFMLVFASCTALVMAGRSAPAGQRCAGPCQTTCPNCHNCCVLKAECGKEEKSCWEVECEEICIPCVVLPWQKWLAKHHGKGSCQSCTSGCNACSTVNNGARVKTVRKLKKKTYECPKCKYKWEPACGGNGGCCDSGCCDAPCDQSPLPAAVPDAPTPAEAYNAPSPEFDTASTRPRRNGDADARLERVTRRTISDR